LCITVAPSRRSSSLRMSTTFRRGFAVTAARLTCALLRCAVAAAADAVRTTAVSAIQACRLATGGEPRDSYLTDS
jgi:hypothetical protein